MINNLEIKNYRKFDSEGVYLSNLSLVNYIVGENGSGKSTLLDYLYETGEESDNVFLFTSGLEMSKPIAEVDIKQACGTNRDNQWRNLFLDFLEKRILVLDILGYILVSRTTNTKAVNWEDIELARDFLAEVGIDIPDLQSVQASKVDSEHLSGGKQKIFNLVYSILFIHKIYKDDAVILIEEPADHLHPSWQKRLPEVFENLAKYTGIQIFIATHSPFIISSVGVLTEDVRESMLNQKVYFLKDFRVAGKRGDISNKGRNGYWGGKVTQITTKMLGAGLIDLISPQTASITQDSPTLIICEGEGRDEDSKVYNRIFSCREPYSLFVSARGSSQVSRTFELLQEIKPGLAANFKMIMLRDRDHEFPTQEHIKKYCKSNPNNRVLQKRAIECYIYNTEVARRLLEFYNQELSAKDAFKLDSLQSQIQSEVEKAIPDSTYKERLKKLFNKVTLGRLHDFVGDDEPMVRLAEFVTPETKTYKELEKIIFN